MSSHEPSREIARVTLQIHIEELRRRCEAVSRFQGGITHYLEERGIFQSYAEEVGLILPTPPPELNRAPDEEGNEHQVWHQTTSDTVIKATWPDFFGLLVIHRPDEEPKASPIAYLERWLLHNELFGDDVQFLGALATPQGLRLLIRQTAIQGTPASEEEIARFFIQSGWRKFIIDGNTAYFDPDRQIAVSDTHRGNIVLMPDGNLAPIDLRVQHLSGSLIDAVKRLINERHA
jgi:hypothetical protein